MKILNGMRTQTELLRDIAGKQDKIVAATGTGARWTAMDGTVRAWLIAGDVYVGIVIHDDKPYGRVTTHILVTDKTTHRQTWRVVDVMEYTTQDAAIAQYIGIIAIIMNRKEHV